jgi:hypothetical protein
MERKVFTMKYFKIFSFLVIPAALLIAGGCSDDKNTTGPESSYAKVRVIHTSYDAPAVDVSVDDQVAISDLAYGQSSGYADVESGMRNVKVTPTGETEPVVIEADLNLAADGEYTVFAMDELASIEAVVSADSRTPNANAAKIRFVHASPDAPAVDIKLNSGDGPTVFSNTAFKGITDYASVDAGSYTFVVTATGSTDEVVRFNPISVTAGNVYTVVAHGTLSSADDYDFGVRVFIDNDEGTQYVDLTIAETTTSLLRVVHTSYDAPSVDVWVDGEVAISDLAYGMSSGYATVNSGSRQVQVTPSGSSSPVVIDANLDLSENTDYTVFAIDELASIMPLVSTDMRETNSSMAKVRFLHASPDAPAVDIKLNSGDGPAVFSNKAFGDLTDYAEVDGGSYTFVVTPTGAGSEVVVFEPATLVDGNVYTVVAHGTLDNSDDYPFAVRVFVDNGEGMSYVDLTPATSNVLVVHASPDAPGVDLLVDDLVMNTSALEYPDNTGYLGIGSGDRNIKVNASGTEATVIDADLNLMPGMNYSIFATDEVAEIAPLVLTDDLSSPASGNAHVRFIHLSPDAPAVDITLTDGTIVFGDYSFGEYSDFTPLSASTYDLQVRLQGTDTVVLNLPGIMLEDGHIYTVFAKGFVGGEGDQALGAEIIVNM